MKKASILGSVIVGVCGVILYCPFNSNKVEAIGIPNNQINFVDSITTNNNVEVDSTEEPANFSWVISR